MTSSPARLLIVAYAALTALLQLYVLLANDLSYQSPREAFFAIGVNALIVWRLWNGSATAWIIACSFDLLGIVALVLFSFDIGLTPMVLIVYSVAQLMILVSDPVRAYVWSSHGPSVSTG